MIELDKSEKYNIGIGRFSKFIDLNADTIDWKLIVTYFKVYDLFLTHNIEFTYNYNKEEYATEISRFLIDVFDRDEKKGLLLINELIMQINLKEEKKAGLKSILNYFNDGKMTISNFTQTYHLNESEKLIPSENIPGAFYRLLVEEINFQYQSHHAVSLSILIRKLFENLIIDILRKKYGTEKLSMYYDSSRRRFHDFSHLLENISNNIGDFNHISQNFDKDFIKELNIYRETGNSGAHSIDENINMEQFTSKQKDINYRLNLLFRVLDNISNNNN